MLVNIEKDTQEKFWLYVQEGKQRRYLDRLDTLTQARAVKYRLLGIKNPFRHF